MNVSNILIVILWTYPPPTALFPKHYSWMVPNKHLKSSLDTKQKLFIKLQLSQRKIFAIKSGVRVPIDP